MRCGTVGEGRGQGGTLAHHGGVTGVYRVAAAAQEQFGE